MCKRKVLKAVYLLCAAISAASFAPPAEAQIDFKLKTTAGSAAVLERYYYNRGVQKDCVRGVLDGCVAPVNSSQVVNWTGEFSGRADVNSTAQALSVSGHMQHSGVDKENKYGEATSNYMAQVFADVPPGAGVKIMFRHSVSTTWNIPVNGGYGQAAWSFSPYGQPLPSVGGGVGVNRAVPSGAPLEVSVSTVETTARAPSPYIEDGGVLLDGGKTYYYIGYFDISGYMWMGREIPAGESGSYSSSIDNIEVRHIGKVLKKLPAGDAQTGLVTKPLPKGLNVRVINDDTGIPVANEPVTFSVVAPGHNASLSATPVTDLNGYATAYLTLGTSTGTYVVRATCPGCLPYVNTATFTVTGVGKELVCSTCTASGPPARELRNPFRLLVLNEATGEPVAGVPVVYSTVNFIDKNGNASADMHGASIRVFNGVTDFYGFSRAYLTVGSAEGTYIVRARCETCTGGQEQIASGIARRRHRIIEVKKTTLADPDDTPIVQITQVILPNDGKSFTTSSGENYVGLRARLLGEEDQSLIRWSVEDDPADFMPSGTPHLQYTNGPSSGFSALVGQGVPEAQTGRPLPLKYKVYAGANVPGRVVVSAQPRTVMQDQIDKCRQEYIDYKFDDNSKLDFAAVPRSKFILGLDENFSKEPLDCYAYIYPTRGQEALTLKNGHPELAIAITSGYRSPRKNIKKTPGSAPNSWHMYGKAVDITANSSAHKLTLWELAGLPKMLERNIPDNSPLRPVTLKYLTSGGLEVVRRSFINPIYNPNGTAVDYIPETLTDGATTIDVTTQTWNQWANFKKFLLKDANGIPGIINNAGWIHLGE